MIELYLFKNKVKNYKILSVPTLLAGECTYPSCERSYVAQPLFFGKNFPDIVLRIDLALALCSNFDFLVLINIPRTHKIIEIIFTLASPVTPYSPMRVNALTCRALGFRIGIFKSISTPSN